MPRLIDIIRAILRQPNPPPLLATPPNNTGSNEIINEINRRRVLAGLHPFIESHCLTSEARKWAESMENSERLGHAYFDHRIQRCEFGPGGEIVAAGQHSAGQAVNSWMNSRGHRNQILSAHRYCGAARSGVYWCAIVASEEQHHGSRMPELLSA